MNKIKISAVLALSLASISSHADLFGLFSGKQINACDSKSVIEIISDLSKKQPENLTNESRYVDSTDSIIKNEVYLDTLKGTQITLKNVETYSIDEVTQKTICNAQIVIDDTPLNQISYETFILDGGESVGIRIFDNLEQARYKVLDYTFKKSEIPKRSNVFLTEEQVNKRDEYNNLQALKIKEKEDKIANERIAFNQAYDKYLTYFESDEFNNQAIENIEQKINEAMLAFFEGEIEIGSMKLVETYKKALGSRPLTPGEAPLSIEEQYAFLKDPNYLNDLVSKTFNLISISDDANLYYFSLSICDGLSTEATDSYHSIKQACLEAHRKISSSLNEKSNELLNVHLQKYLQDMKLTGLQ